MKISINWTIRGIEDGAEFPTDRKADWSFIPQVGMRYITNTEGGSRRIQDVLIYEDGSIYVQLEDTVLKDEGAVNEFVKDFKQLGWE